MTTNAIVYEETTTLNIMSPETVTGENLRSLRLSLGESLSVFGWTLKRAISPKAKRGYSRQYIERLEKGKDVITPKIAGAFWAIATAFDGVPAGYGGAVSVSVLAAPNQIPPGTYVPPTARVVKCIRPGCSVVFLQDHPFRKYHHPDCREAARQERAAAVHGIQ